ncbi:hypothetical protein [Thioclava sp. GXIMD4216]|uniref:Uncharacterized protein n=1 Tax=Thioclava litoralis TaxID=3076557 RepID=A0ABZ1E1Y1_9RHOB|nr:hypothetical protein RPE78_01920 [Thioclava sp. FTW29]
MSYSAPQYENDAARPQPANDAVAQMARLSPPARGSSRRGAIRVEADAGAVLERHMAEARRAAALVKMIEGALMGDVFLQDPP